MKKVKNIKGREITYIAKEAYCEVCGSAVFVPEIHDHNLKVINEGYRQLEDLITNEEINHLVEFFKIGKRPLSLALGWGEGTLTRYLNGDIPTKQYSQIMRSILNEPLLMEGFLKANKEKITESAYKNCEKAIEEFKKSTVFPFTQQRKIDHVIQYLLYKCEEITPLALQKLLYFSQGFNKAINNAFLIEDDCEAWIHGPVYRNVYEIYKEYGYNPIEEKQHEYKYSLLSESEKELLDTIVNNFGCYSGKLLEKMTHIEPPWKVTRIGLMEKEASNRIIDKQLIENYFNDIKEKYKMLNVSDVKDYSEDLFNKIHS
ncbi:type II toxin-antitoxin system antitoxin SocA domain-containing protein [Bacillus sp. DJP31]|uniref:type II toxin-antitoxin system antitoxin SocA domain-containing protein n=1 Tax=Bacillus sp. DJP31 TaxID=3409789 RepID=UPI003BB70C0A